MVMTRHLGFWQRMQTLGPLLAQGEETYSRNFWGQLCLVSHHVLLPLIDFQGMPDTLSHPLELCGLKHVANL